MKRMIQILMLTLTFSWSMICFGTNEIVNTGHNNNKPSTNITLTPSEIDWLNKNQGIRVAVKNGWMPIEFQLENDKHQGLSIDYLSELSNLLHLKFIVVNYTENIDLINQADMISGIGNNTIVNSKFEPLDQPFLTFPYAIYTNINKKINSKINSLENLNNLHVAVYKNANIAQKIRENYPKIKLIYIDIADEAFDGLKSGTIDAYVGNEMVIDYHIIVHRIDYVEKSGITPYTSSVTMAVRKDMPELTSILNKGLLELEPNNKKILNKWKINDNKYYGALIGALGIAFIIFLFVLFRIYRLKQANKKQNDESKQQIWYQSNFDHLTNLPNRDLLNDRLEQSVERAYSSNLQLGILFIDLDNFKKVNDQSGHSVGDRLLIEAARRISASVRSDDTTARFGGDEFIVIVSEIKDMTALEKTCQRILNELQKPFIVESEVFYLSASMGLTVYPDDSRVPNELLSYANQAMYEAKKLGRNRFQFFTESIQSASLNRLSLTNDIREALIKNQFVMYYQPIIDLNNSKIIKAEALVRWNHPKKGFVSPIDFIPLAEESGLINELGEWIFNQAIKDFLVIRENSGIEFQLSINVSPYQFNNPADMLMWVETIKANGIPGRCISIEVTERILLEPSTAVINIISVMRDFGIEFSIDDFGTGYSALAYLKKFDIDYVKIDKSFIHNLETDNYDATLCEAIIDMAHKLGIKVVAEGIETSLQNELLSQFKCDYGQGYLFSRPVPLSQFVELITPNSGLQPL